jgi:hypothetical protein
MPGRMRDLNVVVAGAGFKSWLDILFVGLIDAAGFGVEVPAGWSLFRDAAKDGEEHRYFRNPLHPPPKQPTDQPTPALSTLLEATIMPSLRSHPYRVCKAERGTESWSEAPDMLGELWQNPRAGSVFVTLGVYKAPAPWSSLEFPGNHWLPPHGLSYHED